MVCAMADRQKCTIFEVLFADDLMLFGETATDLQHMLRIFNELVRQFGQEKISVQKTKVVIISTKGWSGTERGTVFYHWE